MEEIYPESILDNLLPHYKFYINKGINKAVLEKLKGGLATRGQMYQRFVFLFIMNTIKYMVFLVGICLRKKANQNGSIWGVKVAGFTQLTPLLTFNESSQDHVIIVESIGDCLNLMTQGFDNVLVSFGLDISSKLLCSIVKFGFSNVILSLNNDMNKSDNRGMQASIKNYLKLLNYFDKDNVKICLPIKNDFGDMNEKDFKKWKDKLLLCKTTDQTSKILSISRSMYKEKKLPKSLIKNLKFIDA